MIAIPMLRHTGQGKKTKSTTGFGFCERRSCKGIINSLEYTTSADMQAVEQMSEEWANRVLCKVSMCPIADSGAIYTRYSGKV